MRSSRQGSGQLNGRFVKTIMFCSYYILYSASTDNDSPSDSHANLFSSFLGLARSFIAFSTSKSFVVCVEVMNIDSLYLDDD